VNDVLHVACPILMWEGRTGTLLGRREWFEQVYAEQSADQENTCGIDGQTPPGLCIAANRDTVDGSKHVADQGQDMEASPPFVAYEGAYQGAEANGEAQV
jgi:hypothetical protein